MKRLLQFSLEFPTKPEDDASVLAFMCHLIRMQLLLPSGDDQEFLEEPALVSSIKSNIVRHEDARATAKYETLGEIIQYLQNMYLANPGFLRSVVKPIYLMKNPYNNKEALYNINQVQNILASVRTANLIEQITGSDCQEMVSKCILLWHLDIYTNAWSKYAQELEKEEPEEEDTMTVGDALKNLSIGVNSLKHATIIINQVNFFIKHLNSELKQLNLLETRQGKDQKQSDSNSRL